VVGKKCEQREEEEAQRSGSFRPKTILRREAKKGVTEVRGGLNLSRRAHP